MELKDFSTEVLEKEIKIRERNGTETPQLMQFWDSDIEEELRNRIKVEVNPLKGCTNEELTRTLQDGPYLTCIFFSDVDIEEELRNRKPKMNRDTKGRFARAGIPDINDFRNDDKTEVSGFDDIQQDVERGLSDVYLGIPGIYNDPVAYVLAYRDGFGTIELVGETYTRVEFAVEAATKMVSDPNDVMYEAPVFVIPVKILPKVLATIAPKVVEKTEVVVDYPTK